MKPIKESEAAKLVCPFTRSMVASPAITIDHVRCIGRACMLWQATPGPPVEVEIKAGELLPFVHQVRDSLSRGRHLYAMATAEASIEHEASEAAKLMIAKRYPKAEPSSIDFALNREVLLRPPRGDQQVIGVLSIAGNAAPDQEGACGAAR